MKRTRDAHRIFINGFLSIFTRTTRRPSGPDSRLGLADFSLRDQGLHPSDYFAILGCQGVVMES